MANCKNLETLVAGRQSGRADFGRLRQVPRAVMALVAIGMAGEASAMELSPPNSDVTINWDNTVRYSLGVRTEKQDPRILNNPVLGADSDALFKRGDVVTNRLDLLTEFDAVYKRDMGLRVSAAGWYDKAYDTDPKNALGLPTNYFNDKFSSTTKRFYKQGGEFLDAFVFGKFEAGNVPVNVKVGRHVNYWGESLFTAYTGVNYGQAPLDLRKALANPGSQAKELFMPLNQISAQAQLTNELSVAGYYGLEWRNDRIPDGGTYLGDLGFLFDGPDYFAGGAPGGLAKLPSLKGKNVGDYGVSARWRPNWLNGTLGFYYRKFDEKLPWVQVGVTGADYRQVFPRNTKLVGLSLSKEIGGVSVGAELVYVKNAGLYSAGFSGAATDNQAARGDMLNGLVNGILYLGSGPLWDSALVLGELTWNHRVSVNVHPELFKGLGTANCAGMSKWDDCSTKNAFGGTLMFAPTWNQVAPSLDLSMPMSLGIGIYGNGSNPAGSSQGAGSYSVGLSALYQSKYSFDLKYNDYLVHQNGNGTFNGHSPVLLSDRGWISFSAKLSF